MSSPLILISLFCGTENGTSIIYGLCTKCESPWTVNSDLRGRCYNGSETKFSTGPSYDSFNV